MNWFRKLLAGRGIGKAVDEEVGQLETEPEATPPSSASKVESTTALPDEPDPHFDSTPDLPQPFGYKVNWFAVRASDPAAVLEALGVVAEAPANWKSGMAAAYKWSSSDHATKWLFASPVVDGWVFLVGISLPYPINTQDGDHCGIGRAFVVIFERLKSRFDEVQFFGSHRVVGFVSWARAVRGVSERVFGYGDGSVYANMGEQSEEEAALGLPLLDGLTVSDATDRIFYLADEKAARRDALVASGVPMHEAGAQLKEGRAGAIPDECDVVALAGLWSLDPTQLDNPSQAQQPGVGLVARLPEGLVRSFEGEWAPPMED
jgi:hypothetical protein